MSGNDHMIWFIATAVMTMAILVIGTLAAAGLIGREQSRTRAASGPYGADRHGQGTREHHDVGRLR
jgi:hypothetical protein